MLLQTMHDVIRNSIALFFRQFVAKSAHKLACASQRECDGEAQHISASAHFSASAHSAMRTNREHGVSIARHYNATTARK